MGNQTNVYRADYAPEVLETFPNKHPENDYFVKFDCPEFTSLCPKTGQPDFATIYISYVPGERMVESKSLKLYLFSFRNHGDFHEDCVNYYYERPDPPDGPNILKSGENSPLAAVYPLIPTVTMEKKIHYGKK